MKEEEHSALETKRESDIRVDDNYRAKLKAVRNLNTINDENTVNMAKQETMEELRAGDYICYYYKPVSLLSSLHRIVRTRGRQEGVL